MSGPTLSEALASGIGIERPFLCPIHGDSQPSASVNIIKMVWVCYACGASGRVDGEDLLGDIDPLMFRRHVAKQMKPETTKSEGWLNVYESSHPYWRSRFSEEVVEHFGLGHDYEADAATYPLRNNSGSVLGVVRRSLSSGPKYIYPYGVDIGKLLFNYHQVNKDYIVLTEGATDAMAAWEVGVDACAIYGARLTKPQAQLIRQLDPTVILCAFDQDEAGFQAFRTVLWRMTEYPVSRVEWHSAKDLASLEVETRRKILVEAVETFGLKP